MEISKWPNNPNQNSIRYGHQDVEESPVYYKEDLEKEYEYINKCGLLNHKLIASVSIIVKIIIAPVLYLLVNKIRSARNDFEIIRKKQCVDFKIMETFDRNLEGLKPFERNAFYLFSCSIIVILIDIPTLFYNIKKGEIEEDNEKKSEKMSIGKSSEEEEVKANLINEDKKNEEIEEKKVKEEKPQREKRDRASTDVLLGENEIALLDEYSDFEDGEEGSNDCKIQE